VAALLTSLADEGELLFKEVIESTMPGAKKSRCKTKRRSPLGALGRWLRRAVSALVALAVQIAGLPLVALK